MSTRYGQVETEGVNLTSETASLENFETASLENFLIEIGFSQFEAQHDHNSFFWNCAIKCGLQASAD
jgi:hypothetical protein